MDQLRVLGIGLYQRPLIEWSVVGNWNVKWTKQLRNRMKPKETD